MTRSADDRVAAEGDQKAGGGGCNVVRVLRRLRMRAARAGDGSARMHRSLGERLKMAPAVAAGMHME